MRRYSPYVMFAIVVGLVLWVAFGQPFQAFDRYYFAPWGEPWWRGQVWGNVLAIGPSAPVLLALGALAYYFHKRAMAPLHEKIDAMVSTHADQHDEHMAAVKSILDALDPDTESESQLDVIADRVDETTPGGLKSVLDAVAKPKLLAKPKRKASQPGP